MGKPRAAPPENVIVEPEGKNTAPCLGLAASVLAARYPDEKDPVMVVLAADHPIKDELEFLRVLGAAAMLAAGRKRSRRCSSRCGRRGR